MVGGAAEGEIEEVLLLSELEIDVDVVEDEADAEEEEEEVEEPVDEALGCVRGVEDSEEAETDEDEADADEDRIVAADACFWSTGEGEVQIQSMSEAVRF